MSKTIKFLKCHGLGNDFVILDDRAGNLKLTDKHVLRICDRHYGIGCDQLIVVENSEKADFKMALYNHDGSRPEMCGNGIRCFARYLFKRKITRKKNLDIETGAGIIKTKIIDDLVEVDMGEPELDGPKIPINRKGTIINSPLRTDEGKYDITGVSMGNPHVVIFVNKLSMIDIERIGPVIEKHHLFPKRINVHFAQVNTRKKISFRAWERGAGATLACGTGACATAVAGVLVGLTERSVTVTQPGGKLKIRWDEKNNRVYMTGPAEEVFTGTIQI